MRSVPRKKKGDVKPVQEPIAFHMAEWFYGYKQSDILSHSFIADQISKLLVERGKWKKGDKVTADYYSTVINDTRRFMIQMFQLTLQNIRQTKHEEGGYKIASEAEATHILEQRIRRFGLAGRNVIEMVPLGKKEHLSRPIREIWAETLNGVKQVREVTEKYLSASDQVEKEKREERRKLLSEETKS